MHKGEDHFFFVINCYNKSGLRQITEPYRRWISVYLLLPLLLTLYAMIIFNIRYKNNNIFEIAEVFEAVSTFGQLVARKVIILMHGPLYEEIIRDRSYFWSYDTFGQTEGDNFRTQMAFAVSLIRKLWFASIFSLVFHFCTPFLVANSVLPDACWIPIDSEYMIIFLYTLEMFFYVEAILFLGVFDAFFLCMCVEFKIQFNLLNKTIHTLNEDIAGGRGNEEIWLAKLKRCTSHHNFLLKVHKKLNNFFSEYFVCQYLINTGGVCIQFFIINNERSNITLTSNLMTEMAFQAEIFNDNIYNIDWQNTTSLQIRKFIVFWMMKAQKPINMSGSGLFQVNRNVLIQMPRLAFSIATILSKVK
ncbi:unnamed protein product [Tenebrio molitor]|nr:unnamed protein product [Tenebrio molitor]